MRLAIRPPARAGGTATAGGGGKAAPRLVSGGLIDAIVPASLEFRDSYFTLSDQYCRVLVVLAYPPRVPPAWLARLFAIPGVTGSVHLAPADPSLLVRQISASISEFSQRLQTMRNPLVIQRTQQSLQDAEAMLKKIDAEQQQVFTLSVCLMVRAGSLEDLGKRTRAVEAAAAAAGMRARTIQFAQSDGAVAAGPFAWLPESLADIAPRQVPSETVAASFPFVGGSVNHGRGIYLGLDADGGMVVLDRWSPPPESGITNPNMAVLATSGAGKSFGVKLMLLREYMLGARVIVIDPEREYRGICKALGGTWVNTAGGGGSRINPLQAPLGDFDSDDEAEDGQAAGPAGPDLPAHQSHLARHVQRLRAFFRLYLPDLTDVEAALLQDALLEVYRERGITWTTDPESVPPDRWPTMRDLHACIEALAASNPDYRRLEVLLRPAAKGTDAGLWGGPTTVPSEADFLVLDVRDLAAADERLQRAQYYAVLNHAWDVVRRQRAKGGRTMVVVDEAWLLADPKVPQALDFLRDLAKRIRKYNGSLTIISQNVVDFTAPEVARQGEAVIGNAATKLLLRQSARDLEAVSKIQQDLSEAELELLANAKRGEGLLIAGSQRVRVRIRAAPHELAIIDPEQARALGGGE